MDVDVDQPGNHPVASGINNRSTLGCDCAADRGHRIDLSINREHIENSIGVAERIDYSSRTKQN